MRDRGHTVFPCQTGLCYYCYCFPTLALSRPHFGEAHAAAASYFRWAARRKANSTSSSEGRLPFKRLAILAPCQMETTLQSQGNSAGGRGAQMSALSPEDCECMESPIHQFTNSLLTCSPIHQSPPHLFTNSPIASSPAHLFTTSPMHQSPHIGPTAAPMSD